MTEDNTQETTAENHSTTTVSEDSETIEELAAENRTLRNRVAELESALTEIQERLDEQSDADGQRDSVANEETSAQRETGDEEADETPVLVTNGGNTCKVIGKLSDSDGVGVHGEATASSSTTYGVRGVTQSSDATAAGVRADAQNGARGVHATASDQIAVFAESTNSFALSGTSENNTGLDVATMDGGFQGVFGHNAATSNTSSTGYGVRGETKSEGDGSAGVYGEGKPSYGEIHGVSGTTAASGGYGLHTPDDAKVGGTVETGALDVSAKIKTNSITRAYFSSDFDLDLTWTILEFDSVNPDEPSAWDAGQFLYKCPLGGNYHFTINIRYSDNSQSDWFSAVQFVRNQSTTLYNWSNDVQNLHQPSFTTTLTGLSEDDEIRVQMKESEGAPDLVGGLTGTRLEVRYLGDHR